MKSYKKRSLEEEHYRATLKWFIEKLELTLIGAKHGAFDPSGKNFMIKKHNELREAMKKVEEIMYGDKEAK